MRRPTFVQFSGTGRGAGKTTTSRALADALVERGHTVEYVEELPIFELPELLALGEQFRRKDLPTAEELLAFCAAFLAARPLVDWIVEDDSWVSLAEDLPWAQTSWEELVAYARRLRACVVDAGFEPVAVFVDTPPAVAVARARRRDGDERSDRWLESVHRLPMVDHGR